VSHFVTRCAMVQLTFFYLQKSRFSEPCYISEKNLSQNLSDARDGLNTALGLHYSSTYGNQLIRPVDVPDACRHILHIVRGLTKLRDNFSQFAIRI